MSTLFNREKNVKINIELIKNDMLDIESNRNDFENYIPFDLCVETPLNKIYKNKYFYSLTLCLIKSKRILDIELGETTYEIRIKQL